MTPMTCTMCNGELTVLGQLGQRLWLRCRDCGIDQSIKIGEEES